MSDGMNKVFLLGNLGADPELRYTTAGVPVSSMRLATNESYVDKNKEPQERTEWHTVVVWGNRAEGLARVLTKGSSVVVEGSLRTSTYEKDGQKRYRTEIHARDVYFAGRRAVPVPSDGAAGFGDEASGPIKGRHPGVNPPKKPATPLDELPY
jgi:single-strand DNA-binding protein